MAAQRIRPQRAHPLWERAKRLPTAVWAVTALVAALLSGGVYTFIVAHDPATLNDEIIGENINGTPGIVTVRYQIYKAPLAEAQCTFQALDEGLNVLGSATTIIGPNNREIRTTDHTVVIHYTAGHPVAAQISDCRITRNH